MTYRSVVTNHGVPKADIWRRDVGYFLVSKNYADVGKFITPTLRELTYTAPYMHNGVDRHPGRGGRVLRPGRRQGRPAGNRAFAAGLTAAEKGDLVAFLESAEQRDSGDRRESHRAAEIRAHREMGSGSTTRSRETQAMKPSREEFEATDARRCAPALPRARETCWPRATRTRIRRWRRCRRSAGAAGQQDHRRQGRSSASCCSSTPSSPATRASPAATATTPSRAGHSPTRSRGAIPARSTGATRRRW